MIDPLEQLVDSLLHEGYALYPYTPQATKNATPTPFGIAYPPPYARTLPSAFDHLEMQCLARPEPGARLHAQVRFLAASGPGHRTGARRAELPAISLEELARGPVTETFSFPGESDREPVLELRLVLSGAPAGGGQVRASLRVENCTDAAAGADRAGALRHSLLSTHPILHIDAGRFVSPLESGRHCASANTWPVLAAPGDDVILGAVIVLPDHPQLAPESAGNLFDGTEIEEALLLHVQTLSDSEREAIEHADPAVAAMVERAAAATPADIARLHGRVTVSEPGTRDAPLSRPVARDPLTREPPVPSPVVTDPSAGQESVRIGDRVVRRGSKVVLRPRPDADLHARMCAGRMATVERIFTELDGRVHFGVTIDGDPGQELMRETNRLLFFFAPEVEPVAEVEPL